MRLLLFLIPLLIFSCSGKKKLTEKVNDNTEITEQESNSIDSIQTNFDAKKLHFVRKIVVREYDTVTVNDTLMTYITKEIEVSNKGGSETSSSDSTSIKKDSDKKRNEDRDIDKKTVEKKKFGSGPTWIALGLFLIGAIIVIYLRFK